jgi:hypothetical protein
MAIILPFDHLKCVKSVMGTHETVFGQKHSPQNETAK